jgi:hypothetical protein
VIVTLAPLQDSFTITNINRCCCRLHHCVCHLSWGSRSHRSRFHQRRGYSDEYGCYAARTNLLSSDDYSWGGGGCCSHCGRGPHAKAPQSSSRVTGECRNYTMSNHNSIIKYACIIVIMIIKTDHELYNICQTL